MIRPEGLENWNVELLNELVRTSVFENEWLEMKEDLAGQDPDARLRLVRTACGFANAEGGFLVYGVADRAKTGERIKGLEPSRDFPREFGDKLKGPIVPSVAYTFLNPPIPVQGGTRVVHVIHIPQSLTGPHAVIQNEKLEFPIRRPKGNDFMDYYLVRGAFMGYYQRRELLKLLVFELWANLSRLESMKIPEAQRSSHYTPAILETDLLQRLLADTFSLLSDDPEIVRVLYSIREQAMFLNQRQEIFFRKVSLPLDNLPALTKQHNEILVSSANTLGPLLVDAIDWLCARFQLKNPLEVGVEVVR